MDLGSYDNILLISLNILFVKVKHGLSVFFDESLDIGIDIEPKKRQIDIP
jgi:hypothetical protein